jgi:hypothetical protein
MPEKEHKSLEIRKRYQDFLLWLFEKINNFPKKQKFLLGDRIGNMALDILEDLIILQYTPAFQKKEKLKIFNLKLEILRDLMRLAWQMKFLSHKSFLFQESKIDEVGRMVYGLACPKKE